MKTDIINEHKIIIDDINKILPLSADKKTIHVVFVADEKFTDFLGLAINSIIYNSNTNRIYDIAVITTDISEEHIEDLLSLIKDKENINIRFAYVNKLIDKINFKVSNNYNSFTYYRLLLPDIVNGIEKILYLDSDVMVNTDLTELYDMNFDGNLLIGTYDTLIASWQNFNSGMRSYFKALGLNRSGEYVQAGVLLFDLKSIKDKIDMRAMIDYACLKKYIFNDQDLINIYFMGKIKIVSLKWNVLNQNGDALNACLQHLSESQKNEYMDSLSDPYIVHFAERSFPCYRINGRYDETYWKYAKGTVFYDRLDLLRIKTMEASQPVEMTQEAARPLLKDRIKDKLRQSKAIVDLYHSVKKIVGIQHESKLKLAAVTVSGKCERDRKKIILEPGAELSCLHCLWNKGVHAVIADVKMDRTIDNVKWSIYSGCRQIVLANNTLSTGRNKIECSLEEAYIDVELVLRNTSNSNIIVNKIVLKHKEK